LNEVMIVEAIDEVEKGTGESYIWKYALVGRL
jgi:hypothetical protein